MPVALTVSIQNIDGNWSKQFYVGVLNPSSELFQLDQEEGLEGTIYCLDMQFIIGKQPQNLRKIQR